MYLCLDLNFCSVSVELTTPGVTPVRVAAHDELDDESLLLHVLLLLLSNCLNGRIIGALKIDFLVSGRKAQVLILAM